MVHNELLDMFPAGIHAEITQCLHMTRLRPNLNKGQRTHLFLFRHLAFSNQNLHLDIVTANILKDVLEKMKSRHDPDSAC